MRKYIVTQIGVTQSDMERTFVIEVSDEIDLGSLSDYELEDLADEAGVEWESDDGVHTEVVRCGIEEPPAGGVPDDLPVVRVRASEQVNR